MHSSRMRTARAITVCWSLIPGGGVPAWSRGVYLPGGVYLTGPGVGPGPRGVWVYLPGRGGVPAWSQGGVPAWSQGCTCLVPGGVYLPGPGGGCTWSGTPPLLWTE